MTDSTGISTGELWARLFKAPTVGGFLVENSGVELPKFEEVVGEHSFDELDPDAWDTCRYACADSDWALQLWYTFNDWFENNIPKHRLICEQIESPTAVFTGMMKYNPKVKRDAVIAYAVHNGCSLMDVQQLLFENGLPLLGGAKHE